MLEFLQEEHLYLLDGVILPSVSQILKKIMPNKYDGIDIEVLNRAAEFGTKGHSIIEKLDTNRPEYCLRAVLEIEDERLSKCIGDYLELCDEHKIKPLEHEKMVHYKDLYAGTLDMIANVKGEESLIDIKFTYKCDKEYLSWQLGMYQLAYGKTFTNHYCIWLPKHRKGRLVKITPKTKEEIISKLKELGYE